MDTRGDRLGEITASLRGKYVTAEQLAASFVRAAITNGAYCPGERITQETIARTLGVSRIPVRAALRQLELEGLVKVVPYRGATVASTSVRDVAEIFELRKAIECYLLEKCMPCLSDEDLRALRELASYLHVSPAEDYTRLQVAFYEQLYGCAKQPRAMKILVGLRMEIERYRLSGRVVDTGSCRAELLDHLAARDVASTQAWLRSHLDAVSKVVQALAEPSFIEVADRELRESPSSHGGRTTALAAAAYESSCGG